MVDISELMTYPYGLTFNCLFAANDIFSITTEKSASNGSSNTPGSIMIVNNVITNLIFNLGYIYSDIAGYMTLDGENLNYWTLAGQYFGDFSMRFWYRENAD